MPSVAIAKVKGAPEGKSFMAHFPQFAFKTDPSQFPGHSISGPSAHPAYLVPSPGPIPACCDPAVEEGFLGSMVVTEGFYGVCRRHLWCLQEAFMVLAGDSLTATPLSQPDGISVSHRELLWCLQEAFVVPAGDSLIATPLQTDWATTCAEVTSSLVGVHASLWQPSRWKRLHGFSISCCRGLPGFGCRQASCGPVAEGDHLAFIAGAEGSTASVPQRLLGRKNNGGAQGDGSSPHHQFLHSQCCCPTPSEAI